MGSHSLPVDSDPANPDWQQIENLLDEIAEGAKSRLSASEFYRLLLERIVPALGASGGAIWTCSGTGLLCLEYQLGLTDAKRAPNADVLASHQPLVEAVMASGEARVAPPRASDSPGDALGNPTDYWLIGYPFRAAARTVGVIELVQKHAMSPDLRAQILRVLAAVVELADDFHRNRELGDLRQREQTWGEYDRFAGRVHRSLDLRQTAFLIANEGRRLLGCDRLSVLVQEGGKCRATAISGVDALDRRAKVVRALEQLTERSVAAGEPLWYCDGAADMPEEIERPLQAYLDASHARVVAIVPLVKPEQDDDDDSPRIIGALVAEQFQTSASDADLRQRLSSMAGHCASALQNALTHSRLPLASVGRFLARLKWFTRARQLPKTVLAALAAAAVVAVLALVPADFNIETKGELEPKLRRDVFASDDGVVSELLVDHGRPVHAGEPLVVLRKPDLDLEFRRVAGEMQTAEKKLAAVQAERLENAPAGPETRRKIHELTADEEELKESLKGLLEQRKILEQQRAELVVRSPIDGQALTWNLKELLESRPVQRGQTLLTVAELDGEWVAELHVPDYRAGHVLAARKELQPDLDVSFALASEPGTVYHGRISDVALATEVDDTNGATVLATVAFDRGEVAGLRPGATVLAEIHCGRRSLGYVWLHDLFEFVQSHWWW